MLLILLCNFVCANIGSLLVGLVVLSCIGLSMMALVIVCILFCIFGFVIAICTLGVGVVVCNLGVGIVLCTLGVGCVSFNGFDVISNVTCFVIIVGMLGCSIVVGVGILFNNSSIFWRASISTMPFVFHCFFKACVRSLKAFTIESSGVKVGVVMCLCLKWTVSVILSLLVCLTYITWHLLCSGDVHKYHPSTVFIAHDPHLTLLSCIYTAHPMGANGILL